MRLNRVRAKFTAVLELDSDDIDVLAQLSYHNGPVSEVLDRYHIRNGVTPKKVKDVLVRLSGALNYIRKTRESVEEINVEIN